MVTEGKSNVGIRLRNFRERQGWSLRALAERSGLSINAISRIERGENSPTVTSLQRLASALVVPITDFFMEGPEAVAFGRHGEGERYLRTCFEAEQLGCGLPVQHLEPYRLEVLPGCDQYSAPVSHPGQEFIFCLSGGLELCIGEQTYTMHPGDSVLFEAAQQHFWRNPGLEKAEVLLVFQAAQDNAVARQRHMAL